MNLLSADIAKSVYEVTQLPFDNVTNLAAIVIGLPFTMFLFLILFGRVVNKYRGITATVVMFICAVCSFFIFKSTWGGSVHHARWEWFSFSPELTFHFGIKVDSITALLLVIVTFVSFLVHLFSIEYLRGDKDFEKYFSYLGLFTFSMLGIVLSDNLMGLFIFWELVGLSSYLLIGFYYQKDAAVYANKKAFIVNRIGDAGFLIGILIVYVYFGSLDLDYITHAMGESGTGGLETLIFQADDPWLFVAGLGLFCGCIGKSAQFPLQVWLPNAMEGPTPVSALIHAATMVAAGVYLLARVFILLPVDVLTVIACIGGITSFMGAFAAMAQNDIKRVLAFSTISQLGYMVMGMGVGAYDASLFHLTTHAFFKAGLFLSSGAVIHSMHDLEHKYHKEGKDIHFDAQDMRIMGGLRKKMPVTFVAYTLCALALAGLPLFSGFLSKDAIISGSWGWAELMSQESGGWVYVIPLLAFVSALFTAFYMGRQIFMVFFGEFRLPKTNVAFRDAFERVIETPWLMRIPIIIFACLSIAVVFSFNPLDGHNGWFYTNISTPQSLSPDNFVYEGFSKIQTSRQHELSELAHIKHHATGIISFILALGGIVLAYLFYGSSKFHGAKRARTKLFHEGTFLYELSANNWYLDDLYNRIIVNPTVGLGKYMNNTDANVWDTIVNYSGYLTVIGAQFIGFLDKWLIDGVVNLFASLAKALGSLVKGLQGGRIQGYIVVTALAILVSLLLIV